MIELNEGSSITKTPLSLIMWKIASNVSFRFGICDIVLQKILNQFLNFFLILILKVFYSKN